MKGSVNYDGLRLTGDSTVNEIFYDCVFSNCNIDGHSLRDCEFELCTFKDCTFTNLKQFFLKINDVKFHSCLIQGMGFSYLSFPHSFSFIDCKLVYVDFINLKLQKSCFQNNYFEECLFENCDLSKSDFTGCKFLATEFRRSVLTEADFSDSEGLDLNHEINTVVNIKIPTDAGQKILKRMGINLN